MKQGARAVYCLGVLLLGARPAHPKEPARGTEARSSVAASSEAPRRPATALEAAAPPEAPAAARAEPPPADLTEQAKQLYLLGAEAFASQRNADAILYFRQAERLVPSAKLTYNIALAYDEMGDAGRALSAYRTFLVQEPESVHRDEVQARIVKFELALAALGVQQLSVTSEPAGALLRVGEELVGLTPWAGELTPGLHRIQLERSGFQPHAAEVAVSAQHASDVRVALVARPAPGAPEPGALARIQPLSWGLLGVGVAALAGGLGFELSRASSSARAGRSGTGETAARAQGAADAKQMASLLLLGAGGAFVVSGGVLLVLDLSRDAPAGTPSIAARSSLTCAPAFCGVVTAGRF
jgi:PEGA domain